MKIVVSGASGFLGAPLTSRLRSLGHDVTELVRHDGGPGQSRWDPAAGLIDHTVIDKADVVINLSGAPIQSWPRTEARALEILASRVGATRTLASAIADAAKPPRFLSGSAIGWYGTDRGDEVLTEAATPHSAGFLADVSRQWEAAANPASDAGAAVTFLRTGIVMDRSGGALKLMRIPFALGGGARLGAGRQWFSTISRRDWVDAVVFVLDHEITGPVNLTSPDPVRNVDFTRELGKALHRPAFLVAPEFALRAVLGGLADDLLGSLRVAPTALVDAGFAFRDPTITAVLRTGLSSLG